jgi:LAO/AO transport system kinase
MQRHATDDGVFIRSLATRGHLGGLSRSTIDVVAVLDAMGYDVVIIETVGVGQDEIDIISSAQCAVVVTVPGLGDDIQAIKAGILEIADVLVVNKSDREGADRTERDLMHMLDLRATGERKEVEIVRTIATTGAGLDDLIGAVERHQASVAADGDARATARAAAQIAELVKDALLDEARARMDVRGGLAAMAADVAARRRDPYGAAAEIVAAVLHKR